MKRQTKWGADRTCGCVWLSADRTYGCVWLSTDRTYGCVWLSADVSWMWGAKAGTAVPDTGVSVVSNKPLYTSTHATFSWKPSNFGNLYSKLGNLVLETWKPVLETWKPVLETWKLCPRKF